MGFGTIQNDQFPTGGILHNSFTKLQNPYLFKSIDGQSPSNGLLRTYKDAGCTPSLPSNSASQPTVKVPDSFKLVMENGMKTEFIKQNNGYYAWLWNDRPGYCFGLKDNRDPNRVQLATYKCNSKKARTWQILMANNNTGYKVQLPNTSYCLADNIGIVDCTNSKATVIDLTAQQLEEFTVNQQTELSVHPIFQPILADIKRKLPQGWVMRLPSELFKKTDVQKEENLYPSFDKSENGYTVISNH